MTECEWLDEQYEEFGSDYIENLIENDYVPIKTQRGWRWMQLAGGTRESVALV